jgi:uncharacterized membrane protein
MFSGILLVVAIISCLLTSMSNYSLKQKRVLLSAIDFIIRTVAWAASISNVLCSILAVDHIGLVIIILNIYILPMIIFVKFIISVSDYAGKGPSILEGIGQTSDTYITKDYPPNYQVNDLTPSSNQTPLSPDPNYQLQNP